MELLFPKEYLYSKPNIICIYKITNRLNNKIYIGQTTNLVHRISVYNTLATPESRPIRKAMFKQGIENFSIEILKECKKEELYDCPGVSEE